jgi:hypothetical protein
MPVMDMVVINNLTGFRIMGMRSVMGMRVVVLVIMRVRMAVVRFHQSVRGPFMAGASAVFTHV